MPINEIVGLLIAERDKLNRAIEALSGVKRRGRPPKNSRVPQVRESEVPAKPRRAMSAARRKAKSKAMKAFWAKKHKKTGKTDNKV